MDNLKRRVCARICQRCGKTYQGGGYKFCSEECRSGRGICKTCGREFQRAREGQKFCGECREANRPKDAVCPYCGKGFASKYGQIFCSKECYESARAHKPEPCPICGKGVPKGLRYCSDECKRRAHGTAHICQQCGREFFRVNKKDRATKYCSPECSQKAQRTRADCTCLQCGRTFHPHSMAAGMYCSHQCAGVAIRTNACDICGEWVPSGSRYCPRCREFRDVWALMGFDRQFSATLEWMGELSETIAKREREIIAVGCEQCGRGFITTSKRARYCSERCRKRHGNRLKDRRVWKNGVPEGSITLEKLFVRDGGRCRKCGLLMSFGSDPNGDKYPSIDHIRPIAKGGLHSWDNVQLMCRGCNRIKRDTMAPTQPALAVAWF